MWVKKFPSGLEEEVAGWRAENRAKILRYFKATEADWNDYQWQLKHVIREPKPLIDLVELTNDQKEAVGKAVGNKIAFGITPYYLGLMDARLSIGYDHAIRAQVIPAQEYVDELAAHKADRSISFDFMGEQDTSPVDLVTRRYPLISILKPFNTCSQICVYCQRNWEIERVLEPRAMATKEKLEQALHWFDEHRSVGDVLITGGDPLVMTNQQIENILEIHSRKKHIYRIRISSRTPEVLPMRFSDKLMEILERYHQPPRLEIALITHFEHSYEITPEWIHVQGFAVGAFDDPCPPSPGVRESLFNRLSMYSIG